MIENAARFCTSWTRGRSGSGALGPRLCALATGLCVAACRASFGSYPEDAGSSDAAVSAYDSSLDAGTEGGTDGGSGGGLFAAPNPWNGPIDARPVSARSAALMSTLASLGGWGNGNQFTVDTSIPVYRAGPAAPLVTVTEGAEYYRPDGESLPLFVPVPASAAIGGRSDWACDIGTDLCRLLVVAPQEHRLYEMFGATKGPQGLQATVVATWDLTRSYAPSLRGEQCTGADSSGLPIAALLATVEEVSVGVVPHALRFLLPNDRMRTGVYVHPATHAGSPTATSVDALPSGARLRLRANFDSSGYSPGARTILSALMQYGMILTDHGEASLTLASDTGAAATWASMGILPSTFSTLRPADFEVVDLDAPLALDFHCIRNP